MAKKRKRKIIISFIVGLSIYRAAAFGAPLPGAHGFQNIKHLNVVIMVFNRE